LQQNFLTARAVGWFLVEIEVGNRRSDGLALHSVSFAPSSTTG
jgi:hypothetical protein